MSVRIRGPRTRGRENQAGRGLGGAGVRGHGKSTSQISWRHVLANFPIFWIFFFCYFFQKFSKNFQNKIQNFRKSSKRAIWLARPPGPPPSPVREPLPDRRGWGFGWCVHCPPSRARHVQRYEANTDPFAHERLTTEQIENIFRKYDADGDALLSLSEIRDGLLSDGLGAAWDLYAADTSRYDIDMDEHLSCEEFIMWMAQLDGCWLEA